jgi:hypothetical protein
MARPAPRQALLSEASVTFMELDFAPGRKKNFFVVAWSWISPRKVEKCGKVCGNIAVAAHRVRFAP